MESFFEGSHADHTHNDPQTNHHTLTPLCATLLHTAYLEDLDVSKTEVFWVLFRVKRRRIGICLRGSLSSCVSAPFGWSCSVRALRGGDARSVRVVVPQVGVGEERLKMWCKRDGPELESASQAGSLEQEIRRFKRELAELRRANEILRAASAFFAVELDRFTVK